MKFRPCIDIHNGKVKQIVGGSLSDRNDSAITNFESELSASSYALMYQKDRIRGGHVILLNATSSPYFESTKQEALQALRCYPGGLQIGGGITSENACEYLDAGASHVIVTSYLFPDGEFDLQRLEELVQVVGKDRLVIDLSCRWRDDAYYVVTNRWQTFTNFKVDVNSLHELSQYCDEFLIHGIEVEGKSQGVEETLVQLLADFDAIPITYAGGIGSLEDLKRFQSLSRGKLNYTIGSALDMFGGEIAYRSLVECTE